MRKLLRATVVASATALTLVASEMAFASASAFASGTEPETPVTLAATSITRDSAILHGTLNPHSTTKVGGHFDYSNPESSSCTENEAPFEGFEGEAEEEAIAVHTTVGLEPHKDYKVCLVATNELGESSQGNEIAVKTLSPPPEVLSESAPPLATSTETTLHAEVDPNNQVTECHFQYGTTIVTEHEVPCNEESIELLEQRVNALIIGLELERTYKYRVILKNAKHEQTVGPTQEFESVAAPTELETGIAEEVTGTIANLGGKLNPGGQATYYVEYGTAPCAATTCGEMSYTLVANGKTQETVTPIVVNDLEPLTTYHYWLVARNAAASTPVHGTASEFSTGLAAPTVETGSVEDLTTTSAELGGELDPGGQATFYVEYGTAPCSATSCGETSATLFVSGKTQASVSPIEITGLQPNTTYHYWLVAKNSAVANPVLGEARAFSTPRSEAELEAEAAALRKPEEEAAAAAAAKRKVEEEVRHGEETVTASAAAKLTQYAEIAAITEALELHEAEATHLRELISATSVGITKTKVTSSGVSVTIKTSQAGAITITGAGLRKTAVKVAAGTHTVEITLTGSGRTARKHHRKTTIVASLTTSLTTVSASATVKL